MAFYKVVDMEGAMEIKVDKDKMKADILSIVERVIEETYDEEEIRKLTMVKYANILAKASNDVINILAEECGEKNVRIEKGLVEMIVQSEVDKIYK